MSSQNDIYELRDRRLKLLQEKERNRLREAYGEKLAEALSLVTGYRLALHDFQIGVSPPFAVSWSRRLEDSPGLNATYISKYHASRIALCIDAKLPQLDGMIGVYGNDYLGICNVAQASISGLVEAAEEINDAVVFYPKKICGAVLVDSYASNPGYPFSVLAQGAALVDQLRHCFEQGVMG